MLILWTTDDTRKIEQRLGKQLVGVEFRVENITGGLPRVQPGDVVLGLGTAALDVVKSSGLCPKNASLTSQRYPALHCIPAAGGTAELALTFASGIKDKEYDRWVSVMLDLNLAIRRVRTGTWKPTYGKYKWVTDFTEACHFLKARAESTGLIQEYALDSETLGLDYVDPARYIIMLQVSYRPGEADCIKFTSAEDFDKRTLPGMPLRDQLQWLLTDKRLSMRAANGKYDLNWIAWKVGITSENFKLDTMLVGSLCDENRGNSLNLHCKWYIPELGGYDDAFNAKYDKARMDLIPDEDLLPYGGGDADATFRVSKHLKHELLRDEALTKFYVNILHPAARAYERVEQTGICIDLPRYLALEAEIKGEIRRLEATALSILPMWLKYKFSDDLNLGRPALIREFLFSKRGLGLKPEMLTAGGKDGKGEKLPSTSGDHLECFLDHPEAKPFIEAYMEWASAVKTLHTYVCRRDDTGKIVTGFLSHVRADGRFHPTFFMFNGDDDDGGTNTGRLSARDPAIQTLPKHRGWAMRLRACFVAPPGMLIMSRDYSQGELKITACLAHEPAMLQAYKDGKDLHQITGATIGGYTWEEFQALKKADPKEFKQLRQNAKAANFGLIYGMGAEGYRDYARFNYGVEMSLGKATDDRDAFFTLYNRLPYWHEEYKNWARREGMVRNPLGRIRHLPLIHSPNREVSSKAGRQAVNSPVQGALSDMSLWSAGIMHARGWDADAPLIAMIHDQNLWYVPEDDWQIHATRSQEVMENLPFEIVGWKPQLTFTTDLEIGADLGSMEAYQNTDGVWVVKPD